MKYFDYSEFDSPDEPASGDFMDQEFLDMLDNAREIAGIPFKINSGFRTEAHNKKVGGVDSSSHTMGYAADISCIDSRSRHIIISALIGAGFNRMGVASTFIHVDIDPSKPANVIWVYS